MPDSLADEQKVEVRLESEVRLRRIMHATFGHKAVQAAEAADAQERNKAALQEVK